MSTNSNKYRSFNQIVNIFYNDEIENIDEPQEKTNKLIEKVRIEPKFIYNNLEKQINLEIFIGIDTMYKIKKLSEFKEEQDYD